MTRRVTYSMGMSLDGYIVGPDGEITAWAPDAEVWQLVLEEIQEVGVHVMGRRLYETMLYWETADQDPSLGERELEWAALWKPLPKVASRRRSSGCEPSRVRATSRSAARRSLPRRPRWV